MHSASLELFPHDVPTVQDDDDASIQTNVNFNSFMVFESPDLSLMKPSFKEFNADFQRLQRLFQKWSDITVQTVHSRGPKFGAALKAKSGLISPGHCNV